LIIFSANNSELSRPTKILAWPGDILPLIMYSITLAGRLNNLIQLDI
jgi:hypothetical protein